MIEAWEARLVGNSADAEPRYEAARDLARARGFRYLDAGAVAKLPVQDVIERVEAKRLGLSLPLGEFSFKEGEKLAPPPFSVDWIRTRLLAPGALDGLNGHAVLHGS